MKHSLRKTTYEDALEHAKTLLDALGECEDYIAVCERARSLGTEITISVRHTYTEEYVSLYRADGETSGMLPAGYAMELWFDLTSGGRVLITGGEDVRQCSYSVPIIEYTSYLLFSGFHFRSLDYVLEHNPITAMLEELLDGIEEEGSAPSPFVVDSGMNVMTVAECGLLSRKDISEGAYTEIALGAYTGAIGGEDSLYFAEAAFLPYRMILHAVMGQYTPFSGDSLTLDSDEIEELLNVLEEIEEEAGHMVSFADLYSNLLSDCPLAAPPHVEQMLDELTACRRGDFLADIEKIGDFLRNALNEETSVTVIW